MEPSFGDLGPGRTGDAQELRTAVTLGSILGGGNHHPPIEAGIQEVSNRTKRDLESTVQRGEEWAQPGGSASRPLDKDGLESPSRTNLLSRRLENLTGKTVEGLHPDPEQRATKVSDNFRRHMLPERRGRNEDAQGRSEVLRGGPAEFVPSRQLGEQARLHSLGARAGTDNCRG